MVIEEKMKIGKRDFVKHFSDSGKMIKQMETGKLYAEAIDRDGSAYTYEETEIQLDTEGAE